MPERGEVMKHSPMEIPLPVWAVSVIKISPSAQQWIDQ